MSKLNDACEQLIKARMICDKIKEVTVAANDRCAPVIALARTPKFWPAKATITTFGELETELALVNALGEVTAECLGAAEGHYREAANLMIKEEVIRRQGITVQPNQHGQTIDMEIDDAVSEVHNRTEQLVILRAMLETHEAKLKSIL